MKPNNGIKESNLYNDMETQSKIDAYMYYENHIIKIISIFVILYYHFKKDWNATQSFFAISTNFLAKEQSAKAWSLKFDGLCSSFAKFVSPNLNFFQFGFC